MVVLWGKMRFNSTLFYQFLPIVLVFAGFVQSLSLNETVNLNNENEFMNGTESDGGGVVVETNSRNSRQLWSLFKNVVKSSLEKGSSGNSNGASSSNTPNPVSGGLGALASFLGSAVSSANNHNKGDGISSDYNGGQLTHTRPHVPSHSYQNYYPPPNQYTNPNEYMHWLLLNSQQNQHASLPHYQVQQQQKKEKDIHELIEKYKEQMHSSASENVEIGDGIGQGASANTGSQILNKLAFGGILDNLDLDNLGNLLSFGRFEDMIDKVNKFDRLKCIPRLLCQMVAKRQEDARTSTTTTTTSRPSKAKRRHEEEDVDDDDDDDDENVENDEKRDDVKEAKDITDDKSLEKEVKESGKDSPKLKVKRLKNNPKKNRDSKEEVEEEDEDSDGDDGVDDDDDDSSEEDHKVLEYEVIKGGITGEGKREGRSRQGRIFKFNGADLALEQMVKFLELMQLKDWSLYPYLNGAYQGHQVARTEECAYRFSTCPFSDDQLVYYFNNYNNGLFHSIF